MNKKERIFLCAAAAVFVAVLTVAIYLNSKPADQLSSPMERALSLYQKGDYKQAMIYFAQADNAQLPEAAFALGAMHFAGLGTPVNIPKALTYYHKAAGENYAPAQTTLALLYMEGGQVKQDPQKALILAQKAAEQNDTEAQMMLAKWFENGEYVEKDMKQAVHFYTKAANNGNMNAKMALSVIYKSGKETGLENPYASKRWEDSIQKQKRFENIFRNLPPDYIEKAKP